jgi:hypothetical protein
MRDFAKAHRDIHSAEGPQKTKGKSARERLSLRTPVHIKSRSHVPAAKTF